MIHYQTEREKESLWIGETEFAPDYELKTESVFAQCNGYMGVRAAHPFSLIEEQRGMFLSGAFNKAYEGEVTELVNCPDVTWFALEVDGEKIYPERSVLKSFTRKLDILSGELLIQYVFDLGEKGELVVENRRFASMVQPSLFAQTFRVQVSGGKVECVKIKTGINGQMTNSGVSHFHTSTARVYDKKIMEIRSELENTTVTEAAGCKVVCGVPGEKEFNLKRRSVYGTYIVQPEEGEVVLEKMTFADQGENGITAEERKLAVEVALGKGYEALMEEQRRKMKEFWDITRIRVDGMSEEEEAAVCFAQYHILGMTPWHTNESSIAAKGLTGEGYKGHVFSDTEIFLFPM